MSQKVISFAGKLDIDKKKYKQSVSNPSYWNKRVRNTFDFVYAPNNPEIEKAYNEAGIPTFKLGDNSNANVQKEEKGQEEKEVASQKPSEAPQEAKAAKATNDTPEDQKPLTEAPEASESDIKFEDQGEKHWSELPWPKMRSLATNFTGDAVKSKEQAEAILKEAEAQGKVELSTIV